MKSIHGKNIRAFDPIITSLDIGPDIEPFNLAQEGKFMSTQPQETTKELVQQFFDGIDDQNPDIMDELLADDFTTGIYRSGTEEGIEGREGMKDLWREYWSAFPDLTGVSTELIAEEDRVAIFREEEGTHEGDFRGIAPTGEQITFEYAGYFVVKDDQIVHGHFLGNILNLLKQLGVEPPIPR